MAGNFGAFFHDYLLGSWEEARGHLKEELEQLRGALNNQASNDAFQETDGTLTADALALGDSKKLTRYIANTGPNFSPKWDKINLANGVKGILAFAFLPVVTKAHLLGRRSANDGAIEEISLGPGLEMTGTTLDVASSASGFAKHFLMMGS